MEQKVWYKSKTVWFNIIALALAVYGIVDKSYFLDPKITALVFGIGNIFIRFITTGAVGFSAIGGKKKK
jgi:hypothetical protein